MYTKKDIYTFMPQNARALLPRDTKIRGKNGEISNAQCIKTKKLILKDLNFKRRKK